jgi:hypothetical protein
VGWFDEDGRVRLQGQAPSRERLRAPPRSLCEATR